MGKFDKMTDAEIYRFLLSETPSKHDLKKIEKPIELMSSDGKYSWACSMLLAFYKSEEQKAFDCIRVAEKRGLLNAEMIAALSLPWVFNGFEKTFSYTGRLFAGIFVARAYENGWGVDRDHAKAVEIAKNFINTPESDPLYKHVQELLAGIGVEGEPVSVKEPVRFDKAPPYTGAHHIEYENGDIYDGEMKDGKRHGKGRLATQFGDIYEGEFQNDKFHGHGIFKELSADEENYWCCEGEWVNGKKEGRFKCWGIVIEDGREDRFEDEFYKNGEQIETEPNAPAPASEPDDETEEQNPIGSLSELKDLYRDPDLFEDPRDKYIENSCYYIEPYVLAVVEAFDSGDERRAARLLADILEIEPGRTYEYAHGDGEGNGYNFIFRALLWASEAVDDSVAPILVNLCYYLWETSDHDGDYLDPVIDLYARQDALPKDEWWFVTLISRLRENGDTETPVSDDDPENANAPVFESEYGEELDDFLADGWLPSANGSMYLPDSAAEDDEEEEYSQTEPVSFTTSSGSEYTGYTDEDGNCHGWGEIQYADGGSYRGFFKNGYRDGFGVLEEYGDTYVGFFSEDEKHGLGILFGYAAREYCPVDGIYFENDEELFHPDFESDDRKFGDYSTGRFDDDYRYWGHYGYNGLNGHAKVWSVGLDTLEFMEGIFFCNALQYGATAKKYPSGRICFTFGRYDNSRMLSTRQGEIAYAFTVWENGVVGCKKGSFYRGNLDGNGSVMRNGVTLEGYFEDGVLKRIDRVILPDFTEGDPEDFRESIGTRY